VITQIPFLATIYYSFQNWNLARPEERGFAGFDNYVAVVTNGQFLPSLWATIRIVGGSVILSLVLGLLIAVLLNRQFRGRAVARTLLITPFLVMPAAAALIWKYSLLEVNTGLVNWSLSWVGIDPIAWNTDYPAWTIVFTLTWQYTPFMMLILLAGLQSQAPEILEAADVDGANTIQTFRFMTLPHLRTYAELATLLAIVLMIQVFDPVNIMTKGAGNTKTLSYLLYERAFIGQEIGEAAAYGVVTVIVTIVVATFALRTLFKVFTEENN
jgi:sorbitol/mannitol transport system permease protein